MAVVVDVTRLGDDQAAHGAESDKPEHRDSAGVPRSRPRHPLSTFALCAAAVLVPIGLAAALVALLG